MNTTKTVILKENYKGMPHTIERSQEVKKWYVIYKSVLRT
jgi:hypothetical protein